jgi:hypothetical protein
MYVYSLIFDNEEGNDIHHQYHFTSNTDYRYLGSLPIVLFSDIRQSRETNTVHP